MKKRLPIVIANWKLNGGLDLICTSVASFIGKHFAAEIVICPPHIYMRDMMTFLQFSELRIGSQNVSRYESGAYTGETSAQMLQQAGCSVSLVGHSERRDIFGESNESCRDKVLRCLNHNLLPVLCIGENESERRQNLTFSRLHQQLSEGLKGLDSDLADRDLCIAYEPLWAIGTGLAATPEVAQEVHEFIRATLTELFGAAVGQRVRILYGGSVNKLNTKAILDQKDVDGLLVGGASLDPEHFLKICQFTSELALS